MEPSQIEAEYLLIDGVVLQLIRERAKLNISLRTEIHPTYIEDVERNCKALLKLMNNVIQNIMSLQYPDINKDRNTNDEPLLQPLFHQLDLSYQCCFDGLTGLCQTILGRGKRHAIIYGLVKFFGDAIAVVTASCVSQAEYELNRNLQPHQKRQRTDKGREGDNPTAKSLTACLVSVLSSLHWQEGQNSHADTLEGILFYILRRTGCIISQITFKEEVVSSNLLRHISKANGADSGVAERAATLESWYIWQIIQAALGGSDPDRRDLVMKVLAKNVTLATGAGVVGQTKRGLTGGLLENEKRKLQSTLVQSIIGESPELAFMDSLKLPSRPDIEEAPPSTMDDDGNENKIHWFIESIWALVGWDMVMSESKE